jgi:hypothetical protein
MAGWTSTFSGTKRLDERVRFLRTQRVSLALEKGRFSSCRTDALFCPAQDRVTLLEFTLVARHL